jgi:hypothetical protein
MTRFILAASLLSLVACGSEPDRAPTTAETTKAAPPAATLPGADPTSCTDGEERECRTIHGGDCFEGIQRCSAGAWSVCTDPGAAPLACTFDSIDVPNLELETDLDVAGAPAVRLSQRGGRSKLTIGTEMFDLGVANNGDIELAERAASFKLRLSSTDVSIVSVAVSGKLKAGCSSVEKLTISLRTPTRSVLVFKSLPEGL